MVQNSKKKFSFGKNWQHYLADCYDEERLDSAVSSLKDFLPFDNLKGKIFLDIGCGSGLFSLAALHLGANKVVSFDVDEQSVVCCQQLKEAIGNPINWEVKHGSILDTDFISNLEKADVVYSWGVLHHTGRMWEGIFNSMLLIKPSGYLYLAIYNKFDGILSSSFWLQVKRFYCRLPKIGQSFLEALVVMAELFLCLARFKNPIRRIKGYKKRRGMSWRRDVSDWLGGYPYEVASPEDIFHFCSKQGLILRNLTTVNHTGNNQFLFQKML